MAARAASASSRVKVMVMVPVSAIGFAFGLGGLDFQVRVAAYRLLRWQALDFADCGMAEVAGGVGLRWRQRL